MFCWIGECALKVSQTGKVMLKHQVFVVRRGKMDLDYESCLGQVHEPINAPSAANTSQEQILQF